MSVSAEGEEGRGGEGNHISRTGRQAGQGRSVVVPLHARPSVVAVGRKEGRKELADELKARKIRKI